MLITPVSLAKTDEFSETHKTKKEPRDMMGCTLAPPDEYGGIIFVSAALQAFVAVTVAVRRTWSVKVCSQHSTAHKLN